MQTSATHQSTDYRFPHIERKMLMEDRAFTSGVHPGQRMPDFDLPTTDGRRVRKPDFVGRQPLLLTFGSFN
jgi:hypothetical protein